MVVASIVEVVSVLGSSVVELVSRLEVESEDVVVCSSVEIGSASVLVAVVSVRDGAIELVEFIGHNGWEILEEFEGLGVTVLSQVDGVHPVDSTIV